MNANEQCKHKVVEPVLTYGGDTCAHQCRTCTLVLCSLCLKEPHGHKVQCPRPKHPLRPCGTPCGACAREDAHRAAMDKPAKWPCQGPGCNVVIDGVVRERKRVRYCGPGCRQAARKVRARLRAGDVANVAPGAG